MRKNPQKERRQTKMIRLVYISYSIFPPSPSVAKNNFFSHVIPFLNLILVPTNKRKKNAVDKGFKENDAICNLRDSKCPISDDSLAYKPSHIFSLSEAQK